MKQLLFSFTIIMSLVSAAWAQEHFWLRGQVSDAESGQPLAYAHIAVVGSAQGTSTNKEGYFRLECGRAH
jgi:hypothetical protein